MRDYSPDGLYRERASLRAAIQQLKDEKDAAVAAEREACAKAAIAEKVNAEETGDESDEAYNQACDDIADAIRARESA